MRRTVLLIFLLFSVLWGLPAQTDNRFIVRANGGPSAIQQVCSVAGCNVAYNLDGTLDQLFLVTTPAPVNITAFLTLLGNQAGVNDAEDDQVANLSGSGYTVPPSLYDSTPVNYYGSPVTHGYVTQPTVKIIGLPQTQSTYGVTGQGICAVIDTGVDTTHPALQNSLVQGYDFTRNQPNPDEKQDLTLSSPPQTNGSPPAWVSQSTAAVVDQSTAAVVDGNPQYSDFGHGTMVSGVFHLVAPTARIMPLKAFNANGTGYLSDILRAIYYAVQNGANILNMSFNVAAYSQELKNAIDYSDLFGVISVAAAGNQGEDILVYPAALPNVMGVASTNNSNQRSSFSNYGDPPVFLAAPGEGVVTTYPFSTWAAGWGTSFSTPFVAGTAALMRQVQSVTCDQQGSSQAMAHAQPIGQDLGNGLLNTSQAVEAWRQANGLP
jgi:subtilisin family serine protease